MVENLVNNPISFSQIKPNKYISFILLIFIILTIIFFNQNALTSISLQGIITNTDNFELKVLVPIDLVSQISNNKELIINNDTYSYQIKNIGEDLLIFDNINYQEVVLITDLKDNLKRENLILNVKIVVNNDKVYQKLWQNLIERE